MEKERIVNITSASDYGISLSARVLGLLPFGLGGNRQNSTRHVYEIESVKTQKFIPSEHYIRESIFQAPVLSYLAKYKYKKPVYMIVGVKIGSNARVVHERGRALGGNLTGTMPGLAVGIPVDVEANVSGNTSDQRYDAYRIPNDFVFAYRLREIRYSKNRDSIDHSEFEKGAELHDLHNHKLQNVISEDTNSEEFRGVEDEIKVEGMAGVDFDDDEDALSVDGCILVGN